MAKSPNPARKLRPLAATLHWLHVRVRASVVSRYLAPASCPRMSFGCEPLPRTGTTSPRSFLPPCEPHLIHRPSGPSNQAYLSLRSSEAAMAKTFRACSSPAPMQPSRILHLQYLSQGKRQSTPRCQSLITPGSDHPPVLGHTGSSISPLMSALTTHT